MNTDDEFAAVEAERAILSALLLDNKLFDIAGDTLRLDHFLDVDHRAIFTALLDQLQAGRAADVVTVSSALQGQVSAVELNELAQYLPSTGNFRRHIEILIERSQSRALLEVSHQVAELAREHDLDVGTRIEQAQGLLSRLMPEGGADQWVSAHEGMLAHTALLERRAAGDTQAWATGLADLDEYLQGGLRPGELVIVGARPSMGKTALGMSIGIHVAQERPVGFLSMEMSHPEVRDRLTAMLGNVTMSAVKRPARGEGLNWERVVDGVERARSLQLRVDDRGGLTLQQVRAKARNAKRTGGLDVLLVDYIGLMNGSDPKAPRTVQLGEISRGLKNLAKELGISVVCLAQLNRKAEERPDSMPQLSDLRDSGEIEQDADVVLFIKRPAMSDPELGPEWKNYAKLSIAKNRQGPCGLIDLTYVADQTRFTDWQGPPPAKAPRAGRGGGL